MSGPLLLLVMVMAVPSDHETLALNERAKWSNGVVQVDSDTRSWNGEQIAWTTKRSATIYFDGDRMRIDLARADDTALAVKEIVVLTAERRIEYTDDKPAGAPIAMTIRRPSAGMERPLICPDIRLLGLVPRPWEGITHHSSPFEFVGQPKRRNASEADEDIDGVSLRRVEFDAGDVRIRCWLHRLKPGVIHRLEAEFGSPENRMLDRIVTEWTQHASTSLWTPTSVNYERMSNGIRTMSQSATFSFLQLNESFAKDPFDIKNLGIPRGTPVVEDDGASGLMRWDGEKLKANASGGLAPTTMNARVWSLVIGSAVLLVLGMYFVRRSQTTSPDR